MKKYIPAAAAATVLLFVPSIASAGVYVCNVWSKKCAHFPDRSISDCGYHEVGGGQWACFPDGALSTASGQGAGPHVTFKGKRMDLVQLTREKRLRLEAALKQPKSAKAARAYQAAVAEALPAK